MENILNLCDFNYAQFKDLVENHKELTLIDSQAKIEKQVIISESAIIKDFSPSPTRFFIGCPEDGVVLSVNDEFCTLRLEFDNISMAYAAYKDDARNVESLETYDKTLPQTLRGFVNNSPSRKSIRVDIAEIEINNPERKGCIETQVPDDAVKHPESAQTDNRGNLIMIHFLKEKGSNVMDHELEWQINDLCSSLDFLARTTSLGFYREGLCRYEGGSDASNSLSSFRNWCKSNTSHGGIDIYTLVRWGGWNNDTNGIAYENTYNVNKYYNDWAFALSCTTCLNPRVLAHEIGHIMGGIHVNNKSDVMYPYSLSTNQHKDTNNRNKISANGIFCG